MVKKVLFILNPFSGKGTIKNRLFEIVDYVTAKGYSIMVHPTQKRKEAVDIIKEIGENFDIIILSGGDGTLNEGVSGLMDIEKEKRPVLGYIPSGSTNDFARSLGLPKYPLKAVECIFEGQRFDSDIGKFGDNYFVYIAAFGAFTDVAYDTPQDLKNLVGHTAYILEGIKRIGSIKSYKMDIIYDGIEIQDEFIFGMISNSDSIGGIKSFKGDTTKLDDGVFECVFIKKPETAIELQAIITGLMARDFTGNEFYFFKAEKLQIKSHEEISWTLDGEFGGAYDEIVIENLSREIGIMVKRDINKRDNNDEKLVGINL